MDDEEIESADEESSPQNDQYSPAKSHTYHLN